MDASIVARVKELAKDPAFVVEMKAKFFEAMMAGYASAEKPKKRFLTEIPGYKVVTYVSGPWKVIDAWQVTPIGDGSGGTTHILYENIPTWMMQYFGKYDATAIPCLKAALRAAYSERKFFGGRGPKDFVHENGAFYRNWKHDIGQHDFASFFGQERVFDRTDQRLGCHSFQGGLMI